MGATPSKPDAEQIRHLKDTYSEACAAAATAISGCDVLLLATGAGFSADSGLKVYADVAKVKAWSDQKLTYSSLCEPHWITTDPDVFWGFWGSCYNDYKVTNAHDGYALVAKWRDNITAKGGREKTQKKSTMSAAQLRKAFRVFDTNGDGYLSRTEFVFVLTKLGGNRFTDAEADAWLAKYDSDHDGRINLDEFVAMMSGAEVAALQQHTGGGGGGAAAAATGAAAKYVPGSGPVEAELVKRQLQLRQNWWADNAADADADADGSGLPTSVARGGGGGDADGSSKGTGKDHGGDEDAKSAGGTANAQLHQDNAKDYVHRQLTSHNNPETRFDFRSKSKDITPHNRCKQREPHRVDGAAGAFHVFTSNVDAHSYDHFQANEIRECHGNIESLQCSRPDRCPGRDIWRMAPNGFAFALDKETMKVPAASDGSSSNGGDDGSDGGGDRKHRLRNMPQPHYPEAWSLAPVTQHAEAEDSDEGDDIGATSSGSGVAAGASGGGGGSGAAANHPSCVACGRLARPAILMFGDKDCLDNSGQEHRYACWKAAVVSLCADRADVLKAAAVEAVPKSGAAKKVGAAKSKVAFTSSSTKQMKKKKKPVSGAGSSGAAKSGSKTAAGKPLSVCILEIGAGGRITTVRNETENFAAAIHLAGGVATIVRINPDLPLPDDEDMEREVKRRFVSIMARGLEALTAIDAHMR